MKTETSITHIGLLFLLVLSDTSVRTKPKLFERISAHLHKLSIEVEKLRYHRVSK